MDMPEFIPPALSRHHCADHTAKVMLGHCLASLDWSHRRRSSAREGDSAVCQQPMGAPIVLHVYGQHDGKSTSLAKKKNLISHQLKPRDFLLSSSWLVLWNGLADSVHEFPAKYLASLEYRDATRQQMSLKTHTLMQTPTKYIHDSYCT